MKKLVSFVALLLAVVMLLSACGTKDESGSNTGSSETKESVGSSAVSETNTIEGTWKVVEIKAASGGTEDYEKYIQGRNEDFASGNAVETYTFTDGKVTMYNSRTLIEESHSYEINGTKVTFLRNAAHERDMIGEFHINGDTLEIKWNGGNTFVLKRQ